MAVDTNDPTTGYPIFLDTGAPDTGVDPTEVAKYAADVGNRIVRATLAELEAYPYKRAGLEGYAEDTRTEYVHNGSGWVADGAGPWIPLVLSTGWSAVTGHTPRGKLINGVVHIEGAADRGAGGALTSIALIPTSLQVLGGKTIFYGTSIPQRSGTAAVAELYIDGVTNLLRVDGYTTINSDAGWRVPLSGQYVRDQR